LARRLGALAAAATGAALLAPLVLIGGAGAVPTLQQAVALSVRPPLARVHEPADGALTLPRVRADGLPFPYWEDRFGWRAVGFRRDRIGGRLLTTVIYVRAGQRIAYTIVPGPPLPSTAGAQTIVRQGTTLHSLSVRARQVAIWLRRGHTCVLSGSGVPAGALAWLGAWRGGGEIPY
jgi:hypothetical protein